MTLNNLNYNGKEGNMRECPKCGFNNPENAKFCTQCATMLSQIFEERRLLTILFADLSGFTRLAHQLDPEDTSDVVNICFKQLNPIITKYGGIIHKYEGDLVIALFGIPVAYEDAGERAVKASLEMMENLPELNRKLSDKIDFKTGLGLHIGITSGIVAVGEIGSSEKKEYTVMGDVVNIASRLKDTAKDREILVSESVFKSSKHLFDYEEISSVKLKGIDKPVKVFKVLKIKEKPGAKRGIKGLHSPLVGRGKEFRLLKRKISELQKGKGGVILILGSAGIGKSRLLEEVKKHFTLGDINRNTPIFLESHCLAHGDVIHYYPFLKIMESVFQITERDTVKVLKKKLLKYIQEIFPQGYEDILPYIGYLFSVRFSDRIDRKIRYLGAKALKLRVFLSIKKLLFRLAREKPLVVVIDDLHWIDTASSELLQFILCAPESLPLLFIGLSRIERRNNFWKIREQIRGNFKGNWTEVKLFPLGYKESNQLISNLLKIIKIPDEFKKKILAKAEGNPFYLEEILKDLIDRGIIIFKHGTWILKTKVNIHIPDTIQSVILSRIDKLKKDSRNILQIASIIGRSFNIRILEHISKLDSFALSLNLLSLEESDFIRRLKHGVEFIFKHPLIQEVTYNTVLKKKRKRLHNEIGKCIEEIFSYRIEDFVDLLSIQYFLAEDYRKAYDYSVRAAEKAKNAYLNKQAIELYTRAFNCLTRMKPSLMPYEERIKKKVFLLKEKSDVLNFIGDNKNALKYIKRAINLAGKIGNKNLLADCVLQLSKIYDSISKYQLALEKAKYAFEIYRQINDRKKIADCFHNIGVTYYHLRDYRKALEYYNDSLRIKKEIKEKETQASTLNNMGVIYRQVGEYEKALKYLKDALKIDKETENRRGESASLNNIGNVYRSLGDFKNAFKYYLDSLNIKKEIGDREGEATSLNNIGIICYYRGDYEKAIRYYNEALKIKKEIGDKKGEAMSLNNIGIVYYRLGEYEKAFKYYVKSLKIREEIHDLYGQASSLHNIGNVFLNIGEYRKALRYHNNSLKIREKIGDRNAQPYSFHILGKIYTKLGKFKKARENLINAKRISQETKEKYILCSTEISLADLELEENNLKKALIHIKEAFNLVREVDSKELKGCVFLVYAKVKTQERKYQEAESYFKKAIKIFKELKQPFESGEAWYYYARLKKLEGDISAEQKFLEKSRQIFKKLSAQGWLKKINDLYL